MTKHFVTGGAGFIGSHLVDKLMAKGEQVVVYDNLSLGKIENIKHHFNKENFKFIQADLLDRKMLKQAMERCDVVWHLAAISDIPRGNRETDLDLNNGTIATYHVLEAMRQNRIKKILFTSSSVVYGEKPETALSENTGPLLPISLYGASKLAAEGLISAYSHLFGIQAWIFRLGNIVGDRMSHGVVFDFIHKLKQNPRELEILGNGNQEKSYLLVEECLDGMFFAFYHSKKQCEVFNLSSASTVKVSRIAQIVIAEMGLENVNLRYNREERGWPGDVPLVRFDVTKMKQLGWEAKHNSEEAIRIATRELLGKKKENNGLKIAAVVYTHNRKELLAKCLEALINQTYPLDKIFVIDDVSIDGTEQVVKEKFPAVTYKKLSFESGGAGAVSEGMKSAYEEGYDWVWIMDDDALPLSNALEELVKVIKSGQISIETVGALTSQRVWPLDEIDPTIPRTKFEIIKGTNFAAYPLFSKKSQEILPLSNVKVIDSSFFSGVLISRQAIESCGLPLKEFFIFWDDTEYSQRLRNRGFKLYQVSTSYVIHPLWRPHKRRQFLGQTISLENYPDWRSYYIVRNEILMYRWQYHQYPFCYTFLRILKWVFRTVLIQLILRLFIGDTGKIKFLLKGARDGVLGRAGKGIF